MASSASSTAVARLEPFLLLAKSARGAGAAKLVAEATAAPGCYIFGELLEAEGVKELSKSQEHHQSYRLLELFAYGAIGDYAAASTSFPPLNQAQIAKLKHLTLVNLASLSRTLSYGELLSALDLNSVRALEDLVIEAIYAGLIQGRLDQRLQRLEVEWTLGRDVKGSEEIETILRSLQEWSQVTDTVLAGLSDRISSARQSDQRAAAVRAAHDEELARTLAMVQQQQMSTGQSGTRSNYDRMGTDRISGGHDMDVDWQEDSGRVKKKAPGPGSSTRSKRTRA